MDYIFNGEKIRRLLLNFYLSTEIAVTFYDSSMKMVATSPKYSHYCSTIRRKKGCVKNCNLSNLVHMERAARTREIVSYTCHAGLMETIMPVLFEDTVIGYMQIGQFRDAEGVYSTEEGARAAAEAYGLDEAAGFYGTLPVVSAERLAALGEILAILIRSFWADGLVRHNRSMLSVKIEKYIEEHIKEKLSIEALCAEFFLSKNALYRLFCDEFGTTVGKYILARRAQLARELLRDSTMPITAIAAECGFTDYNYFIRAFKAQVGVTPLQYRKNK
ncbi:MAG: PocR ligand-binding domain-containing protein [Clostridia bacterium]|nr:PocR ligand-binding domain-containing protein [Clostridia bacterium]